MASVDLCPGFRSFQLKNHLLLSSILLLQRTRCELRKPDFSTEAPLQYFRSQNVNLRVLTASDRLSNTNHEKSRLIGRTLSKSRLAFSRSWDNQYVPPSPGTIRPLGVREERWK